jgi:hypothetical protein
LQLQETLSQGHVDSSVRNNHKGHPGPDRVPSIFFLEVNWLHGLEQFVVAWSSPCNQFTSKKNTRAGPSNNKFISEKDPCAQYPLPPQPFADQLQCFTGRELPPQAINTAWLNAPSAMYHICTYIQKTCM